MLDLIDDDISDSGSESEDYSEDVEKIDLYRENISKNPLDYDSHFKLIKALKYSNDFLEARKAREKMTEFYPLSPELWIEWIKDELTINDDKDFINGLFIRATFDYRSADVWLEYCQFILGYLKERSEIREVFERAISQVGTQFQNGYLIWATYIFSEIAFAIAENGNADQNERVYKLYLRQLSLPLNGNKDAFEEFLNWNEGNQERENEARLKFEESSKLMEKYLPFEDKIENASVEYEANKTESDLTSKEENWLEYLKYGEENMTKVEIINLYERAITEICLSQKIWVRYLRYLSDNFQTDTERIMGAYKQAIRNYKSSLEIWLGFVRNMEKYESGVDEIRLTFGLIFQENLVDENPFLLVWQAYFDFEKRQLDRSLKDHPAVELNLGTIRELFEKVSTIENYADYDPQCVLLKYWAFIEAKYGKNLTKSRQLWSRVMKLTGSGLASLWLEQLDFERRFGDLDHLKRLANNAVNSFPDYAEYLFEKVLRIVAEEADLSCYLQFVKKIESQLKKVNERRAKEELTIEHVAVNKKQKRRASDTDSSGPKLKKVKFASEPKEIDSKQKVNFETIKNNPVEKCEEKTIFVSNLDYKVDEKHLIDKFQHCGKVTDVRIAKDFGGKSRGFAYVQFDTVEEVTKALGLEREPLMNRPMFVSVCNPEKRPSFKYSVGATEANKLFVKNLPKAITKYALENIFGKYGKLKDVRIVTFKNGAPKGIAYVEFFNEDDASKALVGTDGMEIGDNTIQVNISKPPVKTPGVGEEKDGGQESVVAASSSKPSGFIVPRAVQKPMMTQKKVIHGTSSNDDQVIETPKKSNDDFRKFL